MTKGVSITVVVRFLMLGLSRILHMGTFTMSTQPHCWSILNPKVYYKINSLLFYFRAYMELKEPSGTLINILTNIKSIEN